MMMWCLVLVVFLALVCDGALTYNNNDPVSVVSTKVGPYSNPSETYPYYSLPFCEPEKYERVSASLGEVLSGARKIKTGYEILFRVPFQFRRLCKYTMTKDQVERFQKAVNEDYFFEMLVDDLPVWGYVGVVQTPTAESFMKLREGIENLDELDLRKYLYTHLIFSIAYHGNTIISVNVTSSAQHRLDITEALELEVDFTYQVIWKETSEKERVEHHEQAEILPATFEIHWFSIINSFVLVVLLTVFLAIILMRVLKNDFTRYMADGDEDVMEEDSGWKLVHGDVFRFPNNKNLFCAFLGAGTHLLCTGLLLIVLAVFSVYSPNKKGAIPTMILALYAFSSPISGFVSARMYKQMGGLSWEWNTIMAASLFPVPLIVMFSILNTIAIYYDSSAALPFGTIVGMFIYILCTLPFTVVGAIMGKRGAKPFDAPCRTTKVPRQIPDAPWYRHTLFQMLVAGFLPFSAIYIELHYIFASIWGHKVYTLFGILFLALVMLLIVTSFITIALVYFQLAIEDYRWWWRSIFLGGSTGFFVYLYSFFYYYNRSSMSGVLQTTFYFGYVLILSWTFFLILGTVGFFSALTFVKGIYKAIKSD